MPRRSSASRTGNSRSPVCLKPASAFAGRWANLGDAGTVHRYRSDCPKGQLRGAGFSFLTSIRFIYSRTKNDLPPSVPDQHGTRVLGPLADEFETRRPLETAGPALILPLAPSALIFPKRSGPEGV